MFRENNQPTSTRCHFMFFFFCFELSKVDHARCWWIGDGWCWCCDSATSQYFLNIKCCWFFETVNVSRSPSGCGNGWCQSQYLNWTSWTSFRMAPFLVGDISRKWNAVCPQALHLVLGHHTYVLLSIRQWYSDNCWANPSVRFCHIRVSHAHARCSTPA